VVLPLPTLGDTNDAEATATNAQPDTVFQRRHGDAEMAMGFSAQKIMGCSLAKSEIVAQQHGRGRAEYPPSHSRSFWGKFRTAVSRCMSRVWLQTIACRLPWFFSPLPGFDRLMMVRAPCLFATFSCTLYCLSLLAFVSVVTISFPALSWPADSRRHGFGRRPVSLHRGRPP